MTLSGFQLAYPWWLLIVPLPLVVYLFFRPVTLAARSALRVPSFTEFEAFENSRKRGRMSVLLPVAGLIWLLLNLAIARPQWLGDPISTAISGRDLMLAVDISGSMRETDLYAGNRQFSRMDVVRELGREFINRRDGDRIGLIMFGSSAYVQTPLTFDHRTVQHFLGEAEVGLAGRATAIGDAIGLGIKRLRDRPAESRVLILITDGANSAGVVEPLDAARVAASSDIRIHTIGVGSEGAGVAGFGFRVQRSELDEETLQGIATTTGGRYFRARNVAELEDIYTIIDSLEPVDNEENSYRPLKELFPWPLGSALVLSVLVAIVYCRRGHA